MRLSFFARLTAVGSIVIVAGVYLIACSSGSSSSTPTSLSSAVINAATVAQKQSVHVTHNSNVTAQMHRFDSLLKFLSPLWAESAQALTSGLSTIWDLNSGTHPVGTEVGFTNKYMTSGYTCTLTGSVGSQYYACSNGGSSYPQYISVKDYFGQMLDPQFTNDSGNGAGPLSDLTQQSMSLLCTISVLASSFDSDGTPSVGSQTVTFPSSSTATVYQSMSSGGCSFAYNSNFAGNSYTATITAVTGTSNYSKKITIDLSGDSITIYVGLNLSAGNLYLLSLNDQSATGLNSVIRSIFAGTGLNSSSTSKILFEYVNMGYNIARNSGSSCWDGSNWNCDFDLDRLYIDSANDVAYVVSNFGRPGDDSGSLSNKPDFYVQFFGAGQPNEIADCTSSSCTTTIALSMGAGEAYNADGSGASLSGDYNACVTAYGRTIASDNTLSCSLTGTTVNAGSSTGVIELSRQFYAGMTSNIPNIITNTSSSTTVSFTDGTTIFSTTTSQ